MDIDNPETTISRREILQRRGFLRMVYHDWYSCLTEVVPVNGLPVLEVGSGAGFLDQYVPDLITSDILRVPGTRTTLDATKLPFPGNCFRAIVMLNVLHHIPRPREFLEEATRCLTGGGVLAMIEPWMTTWSGFVYRRLHHEPCDATVPLWKIGPGGPLTGANSALPWIIFERDRQAFEASFPALEIVEVQPTTPFTYILSGGFSKFALLPKWMYPPLRLVEGAVRPLYKDLAMFAQITVRKRR